VAALKVEVVGMLSGQAPVLPAVPGLSSGAGEAARAGLVRLAAQVAAGGPAVGAAILGVAALAYLAGMAVRSRTLVRAGLILWAVGGVVFFGAKVVGLLCG